MSTRMLLLVLAGTTGPNARRSKRHGSSDACAEAGFSFLATLLVVLAITLGTLALANRNSLGFLGSAYQSQGRVARAAADIGMSQVVSELNRNRNRRLLVNACLLETKSPTQISTDNTVKVIDGRAFANVSQTFNQGNSVIPINQTIPIGDGSAQQWQLIDVDCSGATAASVRFGLAANPTTGAAAVAPATGELTLTVRGFARQGGATVATSTLTQTLEVVPKCLDRSLRGLGNVFGNDNRKCPISPGSALIFGSSRTDSGDVVIKGGSYNLNIDPVTCIASAPTACVDGLANTSLNVVNITLPPVFPTANTVCSGKNTVTCNINVTSDLKLEARNFDLVAPAVGAWPADWKSICQKQDINGGASPPGTFNNIACSINTLNTKNNVELVFDTSGTTAGSSIPIRLHFPNASTSGNPSVDRGNGSSGIYMCNSNAGGLACDPSSTPSLGTPKITDLTLFGCPLNAAAPASPIAPCGNQFVNLGNGTGASQSAFIYFPYGTVTLGGTPDFTGAIWANDLVGNGNVTINVPTSALTNLCDFMKFCSDDDSFNENFQLDYVTRAVKRLTYF